jgi:hypothetical protein
MKAVFEIFFTVWVYYENNYLNNTYIFEEITIALVVREVL